MNCFLLSLLPFFPLPSSPFCSAEVSPAATNTNSALGDFLCHQLSSGEIFQDADFGSPLPQIQWPFLIGNHYRPCRCREGHFSGACQGTLGYLMHHFQVGMSFFLVFFWSFAIPVLQMEIFICGFYLTLTLHLVLQGCASLCIKNTLCFPYGIYHL